jgi:5-hydroxyisourate hydrolase-like protein (transthyretin family)
VANFAPDSNWGGDTIGRVVWTLIQFDLPAFKPGVIINSAALYAYHYTYTFDPGTVTIVIHRLLGPWDEKTVTWNSKPSYDSTVEATLTKTAGDWGWWIWDITELIKKWIQQGVPNYGLMLRMTAYTGTHGTVGFSSKENELYPHGYLVIDYTPIATSITLTAEKTSIPVGYDIVLTGTLKDASGVGIGGETVTLQEYVNGVWTDVDSTTTATDGSFSFTRSGYGVGTYKFRAVYKGSLNYSASTSPEVTVTVYGLPKAKIVDAIWVQDNVTREKSYNVLAGEQAYVKPGNTVAVNPVVQNVGDYSGTIFARVVKADTGEIVSSLTRTMNPGEKVQFGLLGGTMPSGSYNLRVETGHLEESLYVVDDTFSFTVLPKYSTSITIASDKPSYYIGETAKFSGILKNADTGEGIANQTVVLQKLVGTTWTDVASTQTGTGGSYTIQYTLSEVGTFSFKTVFKGTEALYPSESTTLNITVSKIPTAITFTPNKTSIRVGETVNFSGTLYRKDTMAGVGGQTVKLQKFVWGWIDIRSTTTLSDGSYSFSETINEAGTFPYRAYYPGSATYESSSSSSRDIVVTKIPTSLTITPDKLKTVVDGIINFLGKLTNVDTGAGIGGQTVKLQQLVGGTWTTVLSGTTLSDGTVTFSRTMGSVGDFAFRLAYDGSAMYEPSTTGSVTISVVKIPTILTFSANITQVYVGGEIQFYGNLIRSDTGEGVPDQIIELQTLKDSVWTTVDTRRTDSNGAYTFYVKFDAEGTFRYKAYFSGSDKHEPSDTTPIDVTAIMPTYPTILTLTASSLTARVGESVTFSGYLKTETLEPIADASIKLQQLVGSMWTDIALTVTNEKGFYSTAYKFTEKGNYTFRTIFEGMDPYGPSSSTPVTVTVLAAVEKVRPRRVMLRLDVSKTSITLGETVRFWGNLGITSIMRTIPLPFQNIRVIADSTVIATLRTDFTGAFEGEWKPDKTGTFDMYAEALTRLIGYKIAESNHIIVTVSA